MRTLIWKVLISACFLSTISSPWVLATGENSPWLEGQHATLRSPNGTYSIVNVNCTKASPKYFVEGLHLLLLEKAGGYRSKDGTRRLRLSGLKFCPLNPEGQQLAELKKQVKQSATSNSVALLAYQGRVSVLWSPDSRYVAINENVGSNMTFARLVNARNPDEQIDLNAKVQELLKKSAYWHGVAAWDHRYVNAKSWISPTKLELIFTGHGDDPEGALTLIYSYDLESKKLQFTKKMKSEIAGHV